MGIQDDIFDLEDFLENADVTEKDRFDRIVDYVGELEREVEYYQKFYAAASNLRLVIKEIEGKQ
jgi:hypothetical protein